MTLEIFPDFPEKKSHQQSGVPAIGRPNLVGQSATLSALQRSSHWPEVWSPRRRPWATHEVAGPFNQWNRSFFGLNGWYPFKKPRF